MIRDRYRAKIQGEYEVNIAVRLYLMQQHGKKLPHHKSVYIYFK